MTQQERMLYEVIRAYYLAQFLGDYEYFQRQVEITIDTHRFRSGCMSPLLPGWKQAINGMEEREEIADETDDDSTAIPVLVEGSRLGLNKTQVDSRKTKPAARLRKGL